MVRVFSRTSDKATWYEDASRSIGDAMAERAARLTADWSGDDIAEYAGYDEEIVWKAWHAVLYTYDRLKDNESGLDMVKLTPERDGSKVWTSDYPFAFISSMRDALSDAFANEETLTGKRYFVRPGLPKKVRLFRVPLYVRHVTMGVNR